MSKINAIETMSNLLGSNYQIISNGTADPVVLTKLPDEDLAPKNTSIGVTPESASLIPEQTHKNTEKTTDDYMFQFYLGSLTVVGLFVLFRMIQKSR
jgi:hypothetical protein